MSQNVSVAQSQQDEYALDEGSEEKDHTGCTWQWGGHIHSPTEDGIQINGINSTIQTACEVRLVFGFVLLFLFWGYEDTFTQHIFTEHLL